MKNLSSMSADIRNAITDMDPYNREMVVSTGCVVGGAAIKTAGKLCRATGNTGLGILVGGMGLGISLYGLNRMVKASFHVDLFQGAVEFIDSAIDSANQKRNAAEYDRDVEDHENGYAR